MLPLTLLAAVGFLLAVQLLRVLRSPQPKGTKQLPGPKGEFGKLLMLRTEIDSAVH